MSATATVSLLDQVHEFEERVARARLAPDEVGRERQRALGQAGQARQDLQAFYARGRKDAKRERELRAAVEKAEQEAGDRWDDRVRGAEMAEGVAREELTAFVREHFAEIAAELLPACAEVTGRFERAREVFAEAVRERQRLLDEWRVLIGPAGIDGAELPDDQSIEPPVPRSLAGLLDDERQARN